MGDMELQIFSDRLKQLREELNLTQAQFVEGLDITPSALSAYEKNAKNPSISVAKRIAEKYHISIDWLCGLSSNKNNSLSFVDLLKCDSSFDELEEKVKRIMWIVQEYREKNIQMRRLNANGLLDDDLYEEWYRRQVSLFNESIEKLFNVQKDK